MFQIESFDSFAEAIERKLVAEIASAESERRAASR